MTDRLKLAKRYLAIAESRDAKREAYKRAAEEITRYRAESGESVRSIAASLARDRNMIDRLLRWHASGFKAETPFLMDTQATSRAAASHTKATLRDAPLEEVEKIISALPRDRQQAIAAAAGDRYAKARQEHDEREQRMSASERREREQARDEITRSGRQAVAGFTALGIVGHIEQATDELRELVEDASVTPKLMRQIDKALDALSETATFARALAGGEQS